MFSQRLRVFKQHFACSYLRKITKFYSIIFKFDKVMPYLALPPSEFLLFTEGQPYRLRRKGLISTKFTRPQTA